MVTMNMKQIRNHIDEHTHTVIELVPALGYWYAYVLLGAEDDFASCRVGGYDGKTRCWSNVGTAVNTFIKLGANVHVVPYRD